MAGKTGTTSDYNDVWFSGYTPYYTASVWTGYDNNTKLRQGEERNLAKRLWRACMSKIHEELPSQSFQMPASGIVTATVCSKSGKLPIPGLCDGTIRSEYFAEGTVPTESCNVHYQGFVCPYSNLPANDPCPFKVQGVLELTPPEDASLLQGSGTVPAEPITQEVTNPDGTVSTITIPQANTNTCIHTFEYMTQPGIEGIIEQQRNEMTAAQQAAIQAAQEAAAAQAAAEGQAPPAEAPAPEAPPAE